MTPIYDALDAVVEKMRSVPELVQAVRDPALIYAYRGLAPPTRGIYDGVAEMPRPTSVMVACLGVAPGPTGWRLDCAAFLCAEGEDVTAYELFRLFVDGVPAGESVRLLDCEIHSGYDPINDASLDRAANAEGEYWFVHFTLSEKGG